MSVILLQGISWGAITKIVASDQKKINPYQSFICYRSEYTDLPKKAKHKLLSELFYLKFIEVYSINGWILHNSPVAA